MAVEMPTRVLPVEGAATVDFAWSRASVLVDALNDLVSTARSQLDLRPSMVESIVDWEGRFRDDFDARYAELVPVAADLAGYGVLRASVVVGLAEDANVEQQQLNEAAEGRRAQRPTPGRVF